MQAPIRMTDWNKYRFFYFVAKESSFSKAARLLNASQPSLSRAVASLEGRLNIKLFNRVSRGVTLTQEGKNLFETLRIVFYELSSFEERLSSSIHEAQGLLKVFISHSLSSFLITPYLKEFLETHPKIEMSFTCHDKEGDINCKYADALLGLFDEEAQDLEQRYLTSYEVGLYASEDYLQHYGIPQESHDLGSHNLIVLGTPSSSLSTQDAWMLGLGAKGKKKHKPHLYFSSPPMVLEALEAGMGIAVLPHTMTSSHLKLKKVLPEHSLFLDLYYGSPLYNKASKKVTLWREFLCQKLDTSYGPAPSRLITSFQEGRTMSQYL